MRSYERKMKIHCMMGALKNLVNNSPLTDFSAIYM
jgi:hypothetical protein